MGSSSAIAETINSFPQEVTALLNVQFFIFLTVFSNFLIIFKNYPAIPEILGSIFRTGYQKLKPSENQIFYCGNNFVFFIVF